MQFTILNVALAIFVSILAVTAAPLSELMSANVDIREFKEGYVHGRDISSELAKRECGQGFGKGRGSTTDAGCTVDRQRRLCFDNCNFMGRAGGMRGGGGAEVGCRVACHTMKFKGA